MTHKQNRKPIIFLTAGDPLGIGPEVTVKALKDPRVRAACQPVLIGEAHTLSEAGFTPDLAELIPVESPLRKSAKRAPGAWGGAISFNALRLACKLAAQKRGAAVVTAPISKQSWAQAKVPFTGHTDFLRKHYGKTALMMFASGPLHCALVSEHFAIKDLHKIITKERIVRAGHDFAAALKKMGAARPHIALCSLNPHGGDNGRFGREEARVISPAVAALRVGRINAEGPYPADALWLAHAKGNFDGILCMYHDQALLGLKLAAKEPIVHITAGLDFLRTSPTHGTAFDIAGQNKANPESMIAAVLYAAARI